MFSKLEQEICVHMHAIKWIYKYIYIYLSLLVNAFFFSSLLQPFLSAGIIVASFFFFFSTEKNQYTQG